MNVYHMAFDLKDDASDVQLADDLAAFTAHLKSEGLIESARLLRRKLGLAASDFAEFQLLIETRDLAQLDAAFERMAARAEPDESAHFAVNRHVKNIRFGLYRDFPDAVRKRGEEKF